MSAGPAVTAMIPRRVTRAERIAADIHLFELRDPAGAELPAFTAGAHVAVRVPNGMLRKYSLANDPAERDRYVIAVKREEGGGRGGSESMIRDVAIGDTLPVAAPVNNFELAKSPPGYTFVAGGIGITPIMAMIRHLAATGERFKLYYCTRSADATVFRDELMADFRGQVVIHHDAGDPNKSLDLWPILEKPKGHLYCCGPRGLMQAVRDMTGHWSPAAVHFEAFTDAAPRPDDRPFMVKLARTDATIEVPVGTTILEALRAHGLDVPS